MRAFVRKSFRSLLKRNTTSVEVDGLWVGADAPASLSKIEEALRLIRERDPRRYARLTRDLESVWVVLLAGALGQFQHRDWTCELDERFVAEASVERVALTIVHEATHARLWRRGFRYEPEIRHRVEAICFGEERAFATRLPAFEELEGELDAYRGMPADAWSDKEMRRAHFRGSVAALKHLNAPRWLIGYLLRRTRARRRRERRTTLAARP